MRIVRVINLKPWRGDRIDTVMVLELLLPHRILNSWVTGQIQPSRDKAADAAAG